MNNLEYKSTSQLKHNDIFVRGSYDEDKSFKIKSIEHTDYNTYIESYKGEVLKLSNLCLWKIITKENKA